MSEWTKNEGPAFPSEYIPGTATTPGMSLRDWFAGQALTGMAAAYPGKFPSQTSLGDMASSAYKAADAMLTAREEASK